MSVVQLNDFQRQWTEISAATLAAVSRVGASGQRILGEEVRRFEGALAARWGIPHAVGVGSGLDALEIALRCLDLRPGEKVLTTPLSAFATALAIVRAGATPVFVDTDDQGLLDLDHVERALRADRAIRAVLPVHLYGAPVDLARVERLAAAFDVAIVEDCAQAVLARWGDRPVGSVSRLAATSFYPTKNLGALGDGGAVVTADAHLAERARSLRNYGQTTKQYEHVELGLNSRLDELHAAILHDALLPRLDAWTARRREVAARYRAGLANPALRPLSPSAAAAPVWHLFPLFVSGGAPARDAFRQHLERAGVASGIHYPRLITDQPALAGRAELASDLTLARALVESEASIPIHPHLTDAEVAAVLEACNAWHPASSP